ncbi:hypothetical protein D3C72_1532380 [compost metagenome]
MQLLDTDRTDIVGVGQAVLLKSLFDHGDRQHIVTGFRQRQRGAGKDAMAGFDIRRLIDRGEHQDGFRLALVEGCIIVSCLFGAAAQQQGNGDAEET